MMNKLTHILSIVFLSTLIASCDSNQETHQKSLEEKLVDSFAQEDKPTRVGYKTLEDGRKVRVARKSGEQING